MADSRYAGEAGLQAVFGQIKAAMAEKQDKINDMGLSHNDYSNEEKQKNAQNASDIVSLNNDIDDIIEKRDGDATLYQFAPVVTVEDAVPGNVALRAKVEPTQELHGYDKPWPAGGGKNKLPMTVDGIKALNTDGTWSGNAYTLHGVTFTILTDNDGNVIGIKVNGIAESNTYIILERGNLQKYSGMILNGCPAGGSGSTYLVRIQKTSGDYAIYATDIGSGANISNTITSDEAMIYISINSSYNAQNVIFYPMIRLSTEADATFAPYSNICSIAQYDSCKITRMGKNWQPTQQTELISGNQYFQVKSGALLEPGTYTASMYNDGNIKCRLLINTIIDGVTRTIGNIAVNSGERKGYTFTLTERTLIQLSGRYDPTATISSLSAFKEFQIELGSSVTDFESYKGNYYQIELNGNTYYGQLRIDTYGNVYFDIDKSIVDLGDLTWLNDGSNSVFWANDLSPVRKLLSTDAICSVYEVYNQEVTLIANAPVGKVSFQKDNNARVIIKDLSYNDSTVFTTAVTGQTLCYELATPFTIALKDTPINMVKGRNTIYADIGDVEVIVNNTMDAIGSVQEQANNLVDVIGWNDRKNKANVSNKVNGYINNNIQPGNTIEYISSAATVSYEKIAYVYANKKYMLSWDIDGTATASTVRNGCIIDDDRKVVQSSLPTWVSTQKYYPITPVADGWLCISVDNKTINIQLEEGGEFTGYEPYHKQIGSAVEELLDKVPDAPTTDGAYVLTVTVTDGVPTYNWESAE